MQILASLQQTLEGKKKLFVAFGVINATGRKDQFSTLFGVLNNQLAIAFNIRTPGQFLNDIGGGADR